MEHKDPGSRSAKMLGLLGIRLRKAITDDNTTWKIVPDSAGSCITSQNIDTSNSSERKQFEAGSSNRYKIMEVDWTEEHQEVIQQSKFEETEIHKALLEKSQSKPEQTLINTLSSKQQILINNGEQEKEETNNMEEKVNTVAEEPGSEEEPFSSDDSIADPNYLSEASRTSSSSEERIPLAALQGNELEALSKKKTRKRKAVPSEWKRNKTKVLRNSGQAYFTLNKGTNIAARQIKMPCDNNCRLKCTSKFSEEERKALFRQYWSLADISKQRAFLAILIHQVNPKYTYPILVNGKRKRTNNNAFYFDKDNNKIRVCKVFFVSTLGITNRCIRSFIEKRRKGDFDDRRGLHGKQKLVPENIKNDIRAHINSIPKIESHYIRAHSEKEYIEGGKTIMDLYRDYKSLCEKEGKPFANVTMYRHIFNYEFNLSFFVPKKDQCQRCVAYDNATSEERKEMEENYLIHLKEKQLSREEKQADKEKISENYQISCFDLQATLPTPQGDVSTFYYKSKLSTYNFTVCDLSEKGLGSVTSFMWHEGQGKRGPNEIGSCLLKYLKQKSENYGRDDLEITFYSDNCAGQQKNKFVLAAYFYAVAKYNIKSITHKYFVTGHTQNEGDNVHSIIEKNIKMPQIWSNLHSRTICNVGSNCKEDWNTVRSFRNEL